MHTPSAADVYPMPPTLKVIHRNTFFAVMSVNQYNERRKWQLSDEEKKRRRKIELMEILNDSESKWKNA